MCGPARGFTATWWCVTALLLGGPQTSRGRRLSSESTPEDWVSPTRIDRTLGRQCHVRPCALSPKPKCMFAFDSASFSFFQSSLLFTLSLPAQENQNTMLGRAPKVEGSQLQNAGLGEQFNDAIIRSDSPVDITEHPSPKPGKKGEPRLAPAMS